MNALWKVPDVPSLIKIGEVSSIDPAKCTARVVFDDEDSIVSYDLPVPGSKSAEKRNSYPDSVFGSNSR